MCPITKPKRISPVRAITIFRPSVDRRNETGCAGIIEAPCEARTLAATAVHVYGTKVLPGEPASRAAGVPTRRFYTRGAHRANVGQEPVAAAARARAVACVAGRRSCRSRTLWKVGSL